MAKLTFHGQLGIVMTAHERISNQNNLSAGTQDEDSHESLRQLLKHGLGRATVAAELVCLCGMAPFLYIEAGTFLEYSFYGWRSAWNFMDVVAYVNQVGACVAIGIWPWRIAAALYSVFTLGLFTAVSKRTHWYLVVPHQCIPEGRASYGLGHVMFLHTQQAVSRMTLKQCNSTLLLNRPQCFSQNSWCVWGPQMPCPDTYVLLIVSGW